MPVVATYNSGLTVAEELADPLLSTNAKTVTHAGLNVVNQAFNSGSTVPVTKTANFEKALVAGAATIDLRALVGTNGGAIDGNGLKVQLIKLKNKVGNANDITLVPGASNPYLLFGTDFSLTLKPGQECLFNLNEQAPDISGAAKEIDVSGTGTQVLQVSLVMG